MIQGEETEARGKKGGGEQKRGNWKMGKREGLGERRGLGGGKQKQKREEGMNKKTKEEELEEGTKWRTREKE